LQDGTSEKGDKLEKGMPKASDWDFFDNIYCISLVERPDRKASAEAEFSSVGVLPKVEFICARRHGENSEQGIFESHIRCIQAGLAAGAQTMLIFEDDVIFRRFSPNTLANCAAFLSDLSRWDLFFFGCLVKGSRCTENPCVVKIRYRSLAHAYVINRSIARRLCTERWAGTAFDALLRDLGARCYAAYPGFAFQSDSPTDNREGLRLDRFRRWCGGLCRIQRTNEFYHRRRGAIIAVHVLVIAAIILLAASAAGSCFP
jgi:hypothetical protein